MWISKKRLMSLSLLSLVACGQDLPAEEQVPSSPVGTVEHFVRSDRAVPGQYLVMLKEGTGEVAALSTQLAHRYGGEVFEVYTSVARGFAVRMSEAAAKSLARHPSVALVEEDGLFQEEKEGFTLQAVQPTTSAGLDRINQRYLPLDGTFSYSLTGAGVNAYIFATGIRKSHVEFQVNRAVTGYDAITPGGDASDCQGVGTHSAGIVGGTQYGVAKAVKLWSVRVLDCQGATTTSLVIAGLNWVASNHIKPAVAHLPLGGAASTALDNAVVNLINAGVPVVVPAGSSASNACNYSPARVPQAITVGSSSVSDSVAASSNYGPCVDFYAPGTATAAWYTSDTAYQTLSGSSVASAFVTGVVALYLQGNPGSSSAAVGSAILNNATPGVLTGVPAGSSNRLLYTNY
ncbi:S8 family peptidase [Stigmatella aurantiaca]|uniref:Aqualysin-1 n=1 Tax=Stigmatella aurantiaca (strain DW4/3-1) TaxID=378806 RepID=Q09BP2_STIAD|nr:S8 family peptidase [Stigmatella aurantiaca]ADO74000.1 Proteinase inhibitor I9 [Stigmatella aurantiaca DW4/3-1]EAU69117.1 aqualysin-1 [Stigmatella aurantiaca DW4/3-1]